MCWARPLKYEEQAKVEKQTERKKVSFSSGNIIPILSFVFRRKIDVDGVRNERKKGNAGRKKTRTMLEISAREVTVL